MTGLNVIPRVPIVIVGGGVVGLAIAYELSKSRKGVVVLEKHKYLGAHQSSRNSGVIHSGIYYKENSLKARLCVEGNRLLYRFSQTYSIPHERVGKLIVAMNAEEDAKLDGYLERAHHNGVPGARKVTPRFISAHEPNIMGRSGLFVPSAGVIDAAAYLRVLTSLARTNGTTILTEREVIRIVPSSDGFLVIMRDTQGGEETFETKVLINAAGLWADAIARMVDPQSPHEIEPVRGEYCTFNRLKRKDLCLSGINVYTLPKYFVGSDGSQKFSVGVHLTPTFDYDPKRGPVVGNTILVGPSAKSVADKEDYEQNRLPPAYFFEEIKSLLPSLRPEDLSLGYTGIRAKRKGPYEDFVIERDKKFPNFINLVGIDSPGLTASLAIASCVRRILRSQ